MIRGLLRLMAGKFSLSSRMKNDLFSKVKNTMRVTSDLLLALTYCELHIQPKD